MQVPASIKSLPWRAVVGLLLAGLLGWLAAWLVIPAGPAPGAAGKEASPLARPSASPPGQIAPDGAIGARPEGSAPRASLEQLLQRQDKLSEGAARSSAALPAQPASAAQGGASRAPAGKPGTPDARLAAREARMKAMRELHTMALADIQAVAPGDTKGLMAAMARFDAKMQEAGAPAMIDMDNLRKTLETTDRVQQLNRQLIAEADKGRAADINKVKALSQEIQTLQRTMPRQFIKPEVLQKQLAASP